MNNLRNFSIMSLLLFVGVVMLHADSPTSKKESLLLGPGDMVRMEVYDTPEMGQRARITDNGDLPLSFVGNVSVVGLTPEQASRRVEERLIAGGIMRHPQVMLHVETYATQNVSVMGQVLKPGVYEVDTKRTVVDVLSLAGGLTDLADRHITIERAGPGKRQVDYYFSNQAADALTDDPMVFPGDIVVVPRVPVVYVLGDVSRPGGFPIDTNNSKMTVLEAVALAGYANHTAAVGKSKLLRQTADGVQQIDLPLNAMEKGKKADVALLPNDVVFVPFSFMRNVGVNGTGIIASATSAALYPH